MQRKGLFFSPSTPPTHPSSQLSIFAHLTPRCMCIAPWEHPVHRLWSWHILLHEERSHSWILIAIFKLFELLSNQMLIFSSNLLNLRSPPLPPSLLLSSPDPVFPALLLSLAPARNGIFCNLSEGVEAV
jgi:hypothetical protein